MKNTIKTKENQEERKRQASEDAAKKDKAAEEAAKKKTARIERSHNYRP